MSTTVELLESMEAELHQEVYRELVTLRHYARTFNPDEIANEDGQPYIDVRLQLYADGSFDVRHGDASYDQDHRGFWGSGSVSPDDDDVCLMNNSRDLVNQALEQAAVCEEE